jgi:prepilin-type N-terminal cleavage/methylation domain-containing protein
MRRGFTIIELLVVVAVIGVLVGLMVPSLRGGREAARGAACLSNQRSLVAAWAMYADANRGRAMPLADDRDPARIVYWWGSFAWATAAVDPSQGPIAPFLDTGTGERSVFECPSQPWGTYRAQPSSMAGAPPTSTYGYNGYYLCPPMTPGWSSTIGLQKWKTLADVERPSELLVFADTLLPSSPPRNCALLDPPMLYQGAGCWEVNPSPTTAFRHSRAAAGARADGSVRSERAEPSWLTHPGLGVGSIGRSNDPRYVPDWRRWR